MVISSEIAIHDDCPRVAPVLGLSGGYGSMLTLTSVEEAVWFTSSDCPLYQTASFWCWFPPFLSIGARQRIAQEGPASGEECNSQESIIQRNPRSLLTSASPALSIMEKTPNRTTNSDIHQ